MKKNNTAEKAILDAEKTAKAIKEHTEKSLRDLMNEAINNIVKESEDFEENEDSYEEEDVDTEETPTVADTTPDTEVDGGEELTDTEADTDVDADAEGDADEWSDMEEYKVGDNDYDFTGVDGEQVLKVFNKLGDDDQIFVKKNEDGNYEFEDEETGAEYVIELDPDALDAEDEFEGEDDAEGIDTDDFDAEGEDSEIELDFDDEESDELGAEGDEVTLDINDDEEDEDETLDENLGYTDSYQKDVFSKKFNMKEPADKKTTYTMDDGAPEGGEKPWAGKGDMKPFEKTVNECGDAPVAPEANLEEDGVLRQDYQEKRTRNIPRAHKDYASNAKAMNESVAKIIAKAKQIQTVNEKYEAVIKQLKQSLLESAVSTVTLANMNKLLTECTMTVEERRNLAQRFINVKTLKESKQVYETVKRELNEAAKSAPILERQMKAESSKVLNETVVYQTPENNPSLDLWERMNNLYK